jgi:ATP-dependent Clp protease protease subunit
MNVFRPRPKAVRAFQIEGPITDESAQQCIAMLLYWRSEDPKAPARLVIDSPGGSVTATFAILDTMASVGFPVHTHCRTYAAGCAALILTRGAKGCRSADRESTIELCPTTGAATHSTDDPQHVAKFLMKMRTRVLDEFRVASGRTLEEIEEAQERERVFSAEEALAYGLIDSLC